MDVSDTRILKKTPIIYDFSKYLIINISNNCCVFSRESRCGGCRQLHHADRKFVFEVKTTLPSLAIVVSPPCVALVSFLSLPSLAIVSSPSLPSLNSVLSLPSLP